MLIAPKVSNFFCARFTLTSKYRRSHHSKKRNACLGVSASVRATKQLRGESKASTAFCQCTSDKISRTQRFNVVDPVHWCGYPSETSSNRTPSRRDVERI
jgi:hypothetical protein